MFPQNNIVLIGNSIVEQSKSLAHLNKRIINIDSFNDEDIVGEKYINPNPHGIVNDSVITILKSLKLDNDDTLIVVSSEYSREKNYYNELSLYGKVIGNNQKIISILKDFKKLSKALKKQNINFPDIYLTAKDETNNILIKNSYASGGFGVKKYKKHLESLCEDEYYQKYIQGQEYSILFISNKKKKFEIIGINKIYNKKTSYTDFCFSGAMSDVELNNKQLEYLTKTISFFVNNYNLIGINGIDFILTDKIYFLEINPRITQTCFMYDNIFKYGFVEAHIRSVLDNDLSVDKNKSLSIKCFENLFSNNTSLVDTHLNEFDFVSNIPKINNYIGTGEPICTINAKSSDEKKVKKILLDNISLVKNKLKNIEII